MVQEALGIIIEKFFIERWWIGLLYVSTPVLIFFCIKFYQGSKSYRGKELWVLITGFLITNFILFSLVFLRIFLIQ